MKTVRHIISLLALSFISLTIVAQDYYQVLGVTKSSSMSDIRRGCTIKKADRGKIQAAINDTQSKIDNYKKKPGESDSMRANAIEIYRADIALNQKKLTDIDDACETLQDLNKKAAYDKQIGAESDCASREKRVVREIISKGLPEKVQGLIDKKKKFTDEMRALVNEKELAGESQEYIEQATAPILSRIAEIEQQINDLNKEIESDDKKIKTIMGDCKIPSDWLDRAAKLKDTLEKEDSERYRKELEGLKNKKPEFTGIRKTVEAARAADVDVKITSVLGNLLSKIPIPDVGLQFFGQDLVMKKMSFVPAPSGSDVRQGIGFTGIVKVNKLDMQATVFVIEKKDHELGCSLSLALPKFYKISDLIPSFKKLDELSLPKAKLVLSNFNYKDPDGFSIKHGLNFKATLDLTGPLKMLNTLKEKAKELDSIIVSSEPVRFQGVIPFDVTKTEFSAIIPLRLGIDFTKIAKMPKSITEIFKQITTDDIAFGVSGPPKVTYSAQAGIRILLATQPVPIILQTAITIAPTNVAFSVRMKNMLELKYVALGDAAIQLDFDQGLMPAAALLGVPFTGMFIDGKIDLGFVGPNRVNLALAGGARITSTSVPDMVFDVSASNIQFRNLLLLYNQIAKKAGIPGQIPEESIPVMNIDKIKGYMALDDVKIAGVEYSAGFKLAVDAQLFDKKFGFDFKLLHKKMTCSGSAYLPKIDLILKSKRILTFSGKGAAGGPYMNFNFDAKNPIKGSAFGLDMLLDIPGVNLKADAALEYAKGGFKGDVDMTYGEFTTVFGLDFDPKNLKGTIIKFGFKGDFEKFLSKQVLPYLTSLRQQASASLTRIDAAIGALSYDLGLLSSNAIKETNKEMKKTRATIASIEAKITALENECKNAGKFKKAFVCTKVGIEIGAQGTALIAQKAYLEGLLKPGKQVIKSGKLLEDVTLAMSKAEVTRKTVGGILLGTEKAIEGIAQGLTIFKVTEAIGEFSAADLASGKLPLLISLKAEVHIPDMDPIKVNLSNLQFDFKNPVKSGMNIGQKLLEGIKPTGLF